jgi:hypothetical protein
LFTAHSSLLDLVFYEGDQFPAEYKGSLFVALKGSWNRSIPTGYKVVRVPFKDGRPEGYYENFATGFWVSGEQRAEVWGRPAALAVAKDGSLLVADDTVGRSGAFLTRAPPSRRKGRDRVRKPRRSGADQRKSPARRSLPGLVRSRFTIRPSSVNLTLGARWRGGKLAKGLGSRRYHLFDFIH